MHCFTHPGGDFNAHIGPVSPPSDKSPPSLRQGTPLPQVLAKAGVMEAIAKWVEGAAEEESEADDGDGDGDGGGEGAGDRPIANNSETEEEVGGLTSAADMAVETEGEAASDGDGDGGGDDVGDGEGKGDDEGDGEGEGGGDDVDVGDGGGANEEAQTGEEAPLEQQPTVGTFGAE